jgi:predicted RNA-binding Zn-ribbon protein involved in translation (DUF1610 family)
VINELDGACHYEIGGWGPGESTTAWCKNILSEYYGIDNRDDIISSLNYFFQTGHSAGALEILNDLSDNPKKDDYCTSLVRTNKKHIARSKLTAWDLARAVMVSGRGFWSGYLNSNEAWQYIMTAAAIIQKSYDSWEHFAEGYELGRLFWSEGAPHEPTARALKKLLSDPSSPWNTLPFDLPLGVDFIDPGTQAKTRYKKSICPQCAAKKKRPSLTAYVYCDYCGLLADYDFAKACENPLQRPGPVYEQLLAENKPAIDAALANVDHDAYLEVQKVLYSAWVDACPNSCPPRIKDPKYRTAYINQMAATAAAAAFDEESQKLSSAVNSAVAATSFVEIKPGVYRVNPTAWKAISSAVFAQQDYAHKLCECLKLYDLNPDHAPAELLRRIAWSMFVQGWLPMLEEKQLQELLERTGLKSEYETAESDADSEIVPCGSCGIKLSVLKGASHMVCEQCGFVLDVASARLHCTSCGADLICPSDVTRFACPYCQTEICKIG